MNKNNLEAFEAANETAARIDAMVELAAEKGFITVGIDVATDRVEGELLVIGDDGEYHSIGQVRSANLRFSSCRRAAQTASPVDPFEAPLGYIGSARPWLRCKKGRHNQ